MITLTKLGISFEFKHGFSEIDEFEMPLKGYRDDIIVHCPNQKSYQLYFYDNVRLSQEIVTEKVIAEHGLVVVQELTVESISAAIEHLWYYNYFDKLMPISI